MITIQVVSCQIFRSITLDPSEVTTKEEDRPISPEREDSSVGSHRMRVSAFQQTMTAKDPVTGKAQIVINAKAGRMPHKQREHLCSQETREIMIPFSNITAGLNHTLEHTGDLEF